MGRVPPSVSDCSDTQAGGAADDELQRTSEEAIGAVESTDRSPLPGEGRQREPEAVEDQLARGLEGC